VNTRCKPGDLALVFKSKSVPENIGKMVTCVRLLTFDEMAIGFRHVDGAVWLVDRDMTCRRKSGTVEYRPFMHDENLFPIEPQGYGEKEVEYSEHAKAGVKNG
jgi:hypothetical protein